MIKKAIIFLLTFLVSTSAVAEIYKYKDSTGKWVFTDKKPKANIKSDALDYKSKKKVLNRPLFYVDRKNNITTITIKNTFYAPIEIEISSSTIPRVKHKTVVPANSTAITYQSKVDIKKPRMRWMLGDPNAMADSTNYRLPVSPGLTYKITQSFNGRFSHSKSPNKYAVDIAMKVGSYITAARAGTVFWVKEDYHFSGQADYFLDKANVMYILHEDGTYAIYAHLLPSSSLVNIGDTVKAGQKIARAGSSGYSTGPHLHFVICKNIGFKLTSVPFLFMSPQGAPYTPKRGMKVSSK